MKTEIQIDIFGELEAFIVEHEYCERDEMWEYTPIHEIRDKSGELISFDAITSRDLDRIRKEIYNQEHAYYE